MIEMHRQSLLTLDDDRRRLSEEARQKRDELAEWSHRIDQVMVDCDLVPEGSPLDHLRQLRERLEADGRAVRLRATATRRLERARTRHRQALKQIKLADRGIQQFYSRWDVATEQEFLAKVDRRPLYRQARRDAEAAEAAWVEARRAVTEPHDLEHWLANTATLPLEKRLSDACAATDRLRESLLVAEDRRTAVAKRLDAAARDRASEPLQAELASVEQELAAQLDRRRLLERAGLLLEETLLDEMMLPIGTKIIQDDSDPAQIQFELPDGYAFLTLDDATGATSTTKRGGYSCSCSGSGSCITIYTEQGGFG